MNDVYEAIQKNNQNVGGNVIERSSEQFIVRGIGLIRNEEDIDNIVLKSPDGVPVFVKDVADVKVSHAVRQGSSLKDGTGEAVGGIVMMLKGENSLECGKKGSGKSQRNQCRQYFPGQYKNKAVL